MKDSGGKEQLLPLNVPYEKVSAHLGKQVIFGIRPEQITDTETAHREGLPEIDCKINVLEPTGPDTLVFIALNDTKVCCRAHPREARHAGESMKLVFDVSKAVLFDPNTELRID